VADDLVFQRRAHLDLAESSTMQVLQFQIDSTDRLEWRAFPSSQQVANSCCINLIALFVEHHLLLSILLDRVTINQLHWLRSLVQVTCQVLKVMATWLHSYQYHLGLRALAGLVYGLTQLLKSALKDVNLERGSHDFSQCVVHHYHVEVFVYIQGDAQNMLQCYASNLVGKDLSSLTPQVSTSFFSAHDWYLLLICVVPVTAAGTGLSFCASPVFLDRLRPLLGRRYFSRNGGVVNRLQNI